MTTTDSTQTQPGGPINWMTRNIVAANLLMIVLLLGGIFVAQSVKQEVFPEFAADVIRVSVPYPGASPAEVEQGIVLSIEDSIQRLDGIKRITSDAREGSGTVSIELLESANASKALQDVKNEVDRITSFPLDAERPTVSLMENRRRVVSLVVYGEQDRITLRALAEHVRDTLSNDEGITQVELGVTPPLEVSVEISQQTLREYGLTLNQVATLITQNALELPAGELKTKGGRILLRTQERRDYAKEFKDIVITARPDGTQVHLADLATITDTFADTDEAAWFHDDPAVKVDVFRVGKETPQGVSSAVHDVIQRLLPTLPSSVGISVWEDESVRYDERIHLLLKNALLGLVLVLALLGLFLDARLAFWVTLGIPVSMLGAFLLFPFFGASINMISLFAFIITLGIVVDDAVVMGENIYEKREQGFSTLQAAIQGAREIAMPITFAVLTNIIAFMPLFFVPGAAGKFFRQIPSVTVTVFFISLIEALFILPAHLSHTPRPSRFWDAIARPRTYCTAHLQRFIQDVYTPAISFFVRNRYLTMSIALAVLLTTFGAIKGGHIGFTFLPKIDADVVTAQGSLPVGSTETDVEQFRKKLIDAANSVITSESGPVSKGIYSQTGGFLARGHSGQSESGGHLVAVQVSLVPLEERDISATEFSRRWLKAVGILSSIDSLSFQSSTGASEGAAIEFNLSHPDRKKLEQAATELADMLRNYTGVKDVDDGYSSGKRQFNITVTPHARSLGLTASEVGRQLRSAFFGVEALRQQRGRNEVKVRVRLPEHERSQLATLQTLVIRTPGGGEIPFFQAANVNEGAAYTSIRRKSGKRIVSVSADVDQAQGNANQIISELVENELPLLMNRYPGLQYSFGGEKEAQMETLRSLGNGFILALMVIYAFIAVPFRSYLQPLIVMLSIPFGIIGAIAGHFLLGYGLSIISMFGIIALSGVVVNDSLVMIVTANRFREDGLSAFDAVQRAATRRFRPILLTSLTTFFGLAPMIFETSLQARFLIPMAISIGFGILFATVIILIIVPALYLILEDLQHFKNRIFPESPDEDPRAPSGLSTQNAPEAWK